MSVVVIGGYTKDELKAKLLNLASVGIAFAEETVKTIADLMIYYGVTADDVAEITNKELRVALYEYLGMVPRDPVEFLRYVMYKEFDTTLLIKNANTFHMIRDSKNLKVTKYFETYIESYGYEPLASIFYRFKPLFLAFRTNSKMRQIVNKIRKVAVKAHKPMKEDYLNNLTAHIKRGDEPDEKFLKKKLAEVNVFRKVRLAYALKYRTISPESIVYMVRNGKAFATSFDSSKMRQIVNKILGIESPYQRYLDIVLDAIAADLSVEGTKVFMPEDVFYAIPATEKQFIGNIPYGSYVSVTDKATVGIYWKDVEGHRVDLDLALISATGKFGWDANYRSGKHGVMFSGDLTSAPEGAAEHFYVEGTEPADYLMTVNYFNYSEKHPVPTKIIIAQRNQPLENNHMVHPDDLRFALPVDITEQQHVLGLLSVRKEEVRFYFTGMKIGNSISSRNNEYTMHARQYMVDFYHNGLDLRELLTKAGAEFVEGREEAEVDLSLEVLEKDSILKLLYN